MAKKNVVAKVLGFLLSLLRTTALWIISVIKRHKKLIIVDEKLQNLPEYAQYGHIYSRYHPYSWKSQRPLQQIPICDPMLLKSASEIASLIHNRKITAREVCEAFIKRILIVDPLLNAVVDHRFDHALQEADQADIRIEKGSFDPIQQPFLGVPCTIKECFGLEGMMNTAGLSPRASRQERAIKDATAVKRLKDAGFIPLGVTNLSELCMWYEASNKVYGVTCNPYDITRIVGGSSGGEGSIISAAGSVVGLGSDIGGSIRMPAYFNGIYGHKPTGGLIPNTGQYPIAENAATRYLTTGPLCRYATDLWPLVKILSGPDSIDPGCKNYTLGDPNSVSIKGLRVICIDDDGGSITSQDIEPCLREAQRAAAEHLEKLGAIVEWKKIDGLEQSAEIWSAMLHKAGGKSFGLLMGDEEGEVNSALELLKWVFGKSHHTFMAILLAIVEKVPSLSPKQTERLCLEGERLKQEISNMLQEGSGVILYPAHPTVASRHHAPIFNPFNFAYTAIFNVLEFPVTQCPLGLDPTLGMPMGVQIVAAHGQDHVSIAVAMQLEKTYIGWVPPSPVQLTEK